MKKRFLAIFLSALMVLSTGEAVFAEEVTTTASESEVVEDTSDAGVVDEDVEGKTDNESVDAVSEEGESAEQENDAVIEDSENDLATASVTDTEEGIVASGTCGGNLTWTLDSNGELVISGTGEIESHREECCWDDYESNITKVVISEGVTSIGDYAFFHKIDILTSEVSSNLTSITIPESVTSIGDCAFSGCSSLTSITIPDGVTYIGSCAFDGCSSLTSITIPDGVTSIDGLFMDCSSLTSITIPNSVTCIGDCAFLGCSSLTSVTIPDSVESIGWGAFNGCSSLTSVTIPEGVTSIKGAVFAFCSSLTSVTIPESLTDVKLDKTGQSREIDIFFMCDNLKTINYMGTKEEWDVIKSDVLSGLDTNPTVYFYPSTPAAVTNLKAASAGKNKVKLTWTKSAKAEGYIIYGKTASGKYGYIGMTSNTCYTHTKASDTEYNFYWVYPYRKDSLGNRVIGKCPSYVYAKGVCSSVTNLKATNQKGSVKISWTKSTGADGYLIYGKTASGKYGYIGMTSNASYVDKKASKTQYNFYWVFPYHKNAQGKIVTGQKSTSYVYGKAK